MNAFAPIIALGWRPAPAPPPKPTRLSDPTGDAITGHLVQAKLWRTGTEMELTRDGSRLTVRLFLPEQSQSDYDVDRTEATRVRMAVGQALTLDHHAVTFVDSYRQDHGRRGWNVLVKARS